MLKNKKKIIKMSSAAVVISYIREHFAHKKLSADNISSAEFTSVQRVQVKWQRFKERVVILASLFKGRILRQKGIFFFGRWIHLKETTLKGKNCLPGEQIFSFKSRPPWELKEGRQIFSGQSNLPLPITLNLICSFKAPTVCYFGD